MFDAIYCMTTIVVVERLPNENYVSSENQ